MTQQDISANAIRLEGRDLHFRYRDEAVVCGASLEANPGEVLALIGPNGVGKTTLLKLMAGLFKPEHGEVLLNGRPIRSYSSKVRARMVGVVPQIEHQAWPLTVRQIVSLGRAPHRGWLMPLNGEDRRVVDEMLELTRLTALAERRVTELSGGERQLALIARALAQQPGALILDEPTSHLDMRHQAQLLELIRHLAHDEDMTVLVSLHDVNQAALYADRMAALFSGAIRAMGAPLDVMTAPILEEVYGLPVAVAQHPLHHTPFVIPKMNGKSL